MGVSDFTAIERRRHIEVLIPAVRHIAAKNLIRTGVYESRIIFNPAQTGCDFQIGPSFHLNKFRTILSQVFPMLART
jgi:hypothetical protein